MIFKRKRSSLRNIRMLSNTALFDKVFYKKKYNLSLITNAYKHFDTLGWRQGFSPSEFFDTEFYLAAYPDVRAQRTNPLIHYLRHGGSEYRRPNETFDVQLYCTANPDYDASRKTPAEHCIEKFGSYNWQLKTNKLSKIPKEAIKYFEKFFDRDFYVSHNSDAVESGSDSLRHYIEFGQFDYRDPSPHIDTFYLKKQLNKLGVESEGVVEAFARVNEETSFSTQNCESILLDESEQSFDSRNAFRNARLCVHVHCYYPELISEFMNGFRNIPSDACIIVTVNSQADASFITSVLSRYPLLQEVHIRSVPNRGRDIAPFLVGSQDVWHNYDLVLHLHTKVSPHVSWGAEWRRYLIDQTIGSPELVERILELMSCDNSIGCVYPRNYFRVREFVAAEHNQVNINNLREILGISNPKDKDLDYPAGSMAFYRTSALRNLVKRVNTFDQFEEEAGQVDLTLAHALERVLPEVVRASGFKVRNYTTIKRTRLAAVAGLPGREEVRPQISAAWPRGSAKIAKMRPRPTKPVSALFDPHQLDVQWILPSFGQAGAGGHMTIFRIVELLEKFGHHQTLWLQDAVNFNSEAEAKQRIQKWYRPIGENVKVRFLPDDVRQISGDVLIVTDWPTAYPGAQVVNVKERFYFIQDYEPMFHASGDLYLLAAATYDFGFANLCAGDWLLSLMEARGNWARAWNLCADHDVYYRGLSEVIADRPVKIAFYARQYTPRRAVSLGLAAFELLSKQGFSFQVELFGEEDLQIEYNFPFKQHGILSPEKLGELYRSCDIGVVFSSTNYSLIPLEMMACGLPVIELDTESTRAIFKNGEVCFARGAPYEIAEAIQLLVNDPDRRAQQRARGFDFVKDISWEESARVVECALIERLTKTGFKSLNTRQIMTPAVINISKATIFIPTYNAGSNFDRVMRSVATQTCDFQYDVLIIDSGSTDDTVDIAKKFKDHRVRVEHIDKRNFQHGRTRNLGVQLSDSNYVALLTQDASPKNASWLSSLVGGFARGSRVAGVIGRHEAYPEHDLFTKRDIKQTFDNIALMPSVISRNIGLPSFIQPGSIGWGMLMRFYSDNNSAVSKSWWKHMPYPEIDWGEDQVWAEEFLRVGLEKVYVDDSVVYHSHSFDLQQQYSVSFIEGGFWAEHFGIELHPNPDDAITVMNENDRVFALKIGIDAESLNRRMLHNRATVLGRRQGYLSRSPDTSARSTSLGGNPDPAS